MKKMEKFTKGCWHVQENLALRNQILDSENKLVATVAMNNSTELINDNVLLIASAPELLEALITLVDRALLESARANDDAQTECLVISIENAEKAIKKAKGIK